MAPNVVRKTKAIPQDTASGSRKTNIDTKRRISIGNTIYFVFDFELLFKRTWFDFTKIDRIPK